MKAVFTVVLMIVIFYRWIVIVAVIFSWLYQFGVINPRNQFVAAIGNMLYQLTEPVLGRIRRYVPSFGNIDISPLVLIFLLILIELVLRMYVIPNVP